MTSRSRNTARKVAARAVPAFLVAGLGLSFQAAPALAAEAQDAPAIEHKGAETGTVIVSKNDGGTETFSKLQDALQNGYENGYATVELQGDVTETVSVAANPDYEVSNPYPSWYTYEIIMNGHTLRGGSPSEAAVTNRGRLNFWSSYYNESEAGAVGKLVSGSGAADGVVIENHAGGNIDIYNTDVTGTIKNNGGLNFYGDCEVSGTLTNSEEAGTGQAYASFNGGDYTKLTIDDRAGDPSITASAGEFSQDPRAWLALDSAARNNGDGTWSVLDLTKEKLGVGTYYVNPESGNGPASISDDNIQEGLRCFRVDDSTYQVIQDSFSAGTVCYIEKADGTKAEYQSFESALAAANPGETVCLTANTELAKPVAIPSGVSIDGRGHKLTYTGSESVDAFVTIEGATDAMSIRYLQINASDQCTVNTLCKNFAAEVTFDQVYFDEGKQFGVEVDSANVKLQDCEVWPSAGTKGAIHYLKGGELWGHLTPGASTGQIALVYIGPEDLEKIKEDANAEHGTYLYTAKQAARWLNRSGLISDDIYYWPSDGHADNRWEHGYGDDTPEDAVTVTSDHGTVAAESTMSGSYTRLAVTPDPGYQVSGITVRDMYGGIVNLLSFTPGETGFYMPYGGVSIWVTYEKTGSTPPVDPDPTPKPDPVEDVEIPETEGGKVEVEPVEAGETATVVADPDAGQEVRDVIVTDSEGNEIEVTADEDGNYAFEMPEGGATVEVVFGCNGGDLCASHSFGDVTHDDWFHDTVDWAVDEGIFHGYDDGTFGPDDTLTREQAATVMYNYFGGAAGAGSAGMSDVGSDWYTDAVNWAVENGVMTGYSGTDKFGIGDALSREQFCSVIAKAMGADLSDVDLSVLDRFADAGSVSDWAKPAVAWAVENGLMNGVENADGTRSLQGIRDMTRAEMAAMMKNAVDAGVLTK